MPPPPAQTQDQDEEDDLFGDSAQAEFNPPMDEEGMDETANDAEVDEMAAMLMEEMARDPSPTEANEMDATAALDAMTEMASAADYGALAEMSTLEMPALDGLGIMPVEGGVGRRRLASGIDVEDVDDGDDSSDDSDD